MTEQRSSKQESIRQRLRDLGEGGFDLDFDVIDPVSLDCRLQCIQAENLALDALAELDRLTARVAELENEPGEKHFQGVLADNREIAAENDRLRAALEQMRDCDRVICDPCPKCVQAASAALAGGESEDAT